MDFMEDASDAPRVLTLRLQHFILLVCSKCVLPARLYLPQFPIRSLACQTRFLRRSWTMRDACCFQGLSPFLDGMDAGLKASSTVKISGQVVTC